MLNVMLTENLQKHEKMVFFNLIFQDYCDTSYYSLIFKIMNSYQPHGQPPKQLMQNYQQPPRSAPYPLQGQFSPKMIPQHTQMHNYQPLSPQYYPVQQPYPLQVEGQAYRGQQSNVNTNNYQQPQFIVRQNTFGPQMLNQRNQYEMHQQQQPNNYYEQQGHQQGQNEEAVFWSKKFYAIFERFEWAYERFDELKQNYQELCQQLNTVDSQEDWNQLKQHHQQLMERFYAAQEQIVSVMGQNQQLLQQRPQNNQQDVWQQRYQQLLGNYQALQQKHNQSKRNQPVKHDNELSKRYQQLKVQYSKVFNQNKQLKRKQMKQNKELADYAQKLEYSMEQTQKYKQHFEKMHNEKEQLQQTLQQLDNKNVQLKRQLAMKPKFDKQQYDRLVGMLEHKQQQITQLKRESLNKQNQRYSINKEEINKKNEEISALKDIVNKLKNESSSSPNQFNKILADRNEQLNKYRKMLRDIQDDYRQRLFNQQNSIREQYQEELKLMKLEVQEKQEKFNENQSFNHIKIVNSEKRINLYQNQLNQLNDSLSKRNSQLSNLRQKINQLQATLKSEHQKSQQLKTTIDNQKDTIKEKTKQLQKRQQQHTNLEKKLQQIMQKKNQATSKSLLEQIKQLNDIIHKKDQQLNKARNIYQSKEKIINQLQAQCDSLRSEVIFTEKGFEHERQSIRNQSRKLEQRNQQLEKKMRNLEFDFGESVKNGLISEITSLRQQNYSKQDTILKLQNNQIELKAKICQFQRQQKDSESEIYKYKSKLSQYQNHLSANKRKIDDLRCQIESHDKLVKSLRLHQQNLKMQFIKFENQIAQSKSTLAVKSDVIKNLQAKLEKFNEMITEANKSKQQFRIQLKNYKENSQSTIRNLKDQIEEYQQYVSTGAMHKEYENKQHQQIKLIHTLKSENQKFKQQLRKTFDIQHQKQTTPSLQNSKVSHSEGVNYIQKRLVDFNNKLQQMLSNNETRSQHRNLQICNIQPKNKQNEVNINDKEIKMLKQKIIELQQYCTSLEIKIGNDIFYPNINQSNIFVEHQRIYGEQIQFYKSQIKQYEDRIDKVLKVNKQLKIKLQSFLKNTNQYTQSYYKEQLQQCEKNIQTLNGKIKKLITENRTLRAQVMETTEKITRQYQTKQLENENKIQQLNRKIRMFEVQRMSDANINATLKHDISQQQSNIEILKANLGEKLNFHESMNKQLNIKLSQYEKQTRDISYKMKLLETEKDNLSKQLNEKYHHREEVL